MQPFWLSDGKERSTDAMLTVPQRIAIFFAVLVIATLVAVVFQSLYDPAGLQMVVGYALGGLKESSRLCQIGVGVGGALLVWIGVLLMMALVGLRSSGARQIRVSGEMGTLILGLGAVEDFLQRRGKNVAGVHELKIRVKNSRRGVIVEGEANVDLARPVPEFAEGFHKLIRQQLTEVLGIGMVADIAVRVRHFSDSLDDSGLTPTLADPVEIGAPALDEVPLALEEPEAPEVPEPEPVEESAPEEPSSYEAPAETSETGETWSDEGQTEYSESQEPETGEASEPEATEPETGEEEKPDWR